MKILYLVGAYGRQYAANEIHYELGREFVRQGHACVVFAPTTRRELGKRPPAYRDGEVEVEHGVVDDTRARRILGRLSWRLFHYPYFLTTLLDFRRFLSRHPEATVIHADMAYPMGAIAALAGGRLPLVVSVHGGDLIGRPDYGYGRFVGARLLTRLAFRRASLVRVNSPLTAELARKRGCPPEKIRQLLVNIGDRFWEAGQGDLASYRRTARARVCRTLGLPEEALLLLSLGRLIPLKGVEEVVRATARVRAALPQARTLIAGPSRRVPGYGEYETYLKRLGKELGLEDCLTFLGPLDYETQVPLYLAAADLFLSPSHIEGLNRVVAEAGALGTPSVVSWGTGVAPLVEEMGAGLVVPVGDAAALAEAIVRLGREKPLREEMAGRARKMAERFRSSEIASGLLSLYREAAGRSLRSVSPAREQPPAPPGPSAPGPGE
ncbi:MAG: glycosyltransferase [Chloroflexia bacterium]